MGLSLVIEYNGDVYIDGQYVRDDDDDFLWAWTSGTYYDPFGTAHEGEVCGRHVRGHELMNTTTDSRTYTMMRGRHVHGHGWYSRQERRSRRFGGYRARGPEQTFKIRGCGKVITCQPNQWARETWKKHRPYQEHGRVRIGKVDVVDLLHGMYPLR